MYFQASDGIIHERKLQSIKQMKVISDDNNVSDALRGCCNILYDLANPINLSTWILFDDIFLSCKTVFWFILFFF